MVSSLSMLYSPYEISLWLLNFFVFYSEISSFAPPLGELESPAWSHCSVIFMCCPVLTGLETSSNNLRSSCRYRLIKSSAALLPMIASISSRVNVSFSIFSTNSISSFLKSPLMKIECENNRKNKMLQGHWRGVKKTPASVCGRQWPEHERA